MSTDRMEKATPETWMFPPMGGWTVEQVEDLDLPFDWELMDGAIVPRGHTVFWHDLVRDELRDRLKGARTETHAVNVERCVQLDGRSAPKPDVVVFEKRGLGIDMRCTPATHVKLVVEVVSDGSRLQDRVSKPALYAEAGLPFFWRVERGEDGIPVVHEFWLSRASGEYVPAPEHPVHTGKLETDRPFPITIDLASLVDF
ncbi:Uma2 family endonuclease [Streptomyces sp. NPDC047117]|uniref:Uma2 family endonuclease n=1 Tax=unclassified Streptomyces TaxID=2593676 RepID=UPI0033D8C459